MACLATRSAKRRRESVQTKHNRALIRRQCAIPRALPTSDGPIKAVSCQFDKLHYDTMPNMKTSRVAMKSAQLQDRFGDILIACADVDYGHTVGHFLATEHARTERCHDAAGVLRLVGRHPFDVIILDLDLNQDSDVDLVSFIREQSPGRGLFCFSISTRWTGRWKGYAKALFSICPSPARLPMWRWW
jgi:CheY-like chemotaxis protein